MISEETINIAVDQLEDEMNEIETLFMHTHEPLMDYFSSEMFTALEEQERSLIMFIHLTLFQAYRVHHGMDPEFDMDSYMEHDYSNWELLDNYSNWEEAKNAYFKDYPEEEMLAFVEDMLVEEEEDEMSPAAKEVIFISAKSYIDSLN